jgi:hypothetical protein
MTTCSSMAMTGGRAAYLFQRGCFGDFLPCLPPLSRNFATDRIAPKNSSTSLSMSSSVTIEMPYRLHQARNKPTRQAWRVLFAAITLTKPKQIRARRAPPSSGGLGTCCRRSFYLSVDWSRLLSITCFLCQARNARQSSSFSSLDIALCREPVPVSET